MNRSVRAISTCAIPLLLVWGSSARAADRVGLVADTTLGRPAAYGLEALEGALLKKGFTVQRLTRVAAAEVDFSILAGVTYNDGAAPRTLRVLNIPLPESPEALVIRRTELEGKPALIRCGSDVRGLMDAALDVADRISWSAGTGDPFAHVRDTREKPYVRERAVSIYTMQRAYFESRLHAESGLRRDEMKGFWHEVFGIIGPTRPDRRVDLRAKELPDEVIEDGLNQGLNVRVTTKYWMERMGLPFHPTHINRQNQHDRRHGYADLLRYPQRYRVHWRLWNGGTTRLLLWGDPDYVRRFAESTRLYHGTSFEVNEMLATWMLGEPHDAEPLELLHPKYRYYDYEFERYWHFCQVWGRVGYNPDTPAEGEAPYIVHVPVRRHVPGRTVRLRATVSAGDDVADVRVKYCDDHGSWHSVAMRPVGEWQYQADVPLAPDAKKITYFIAAGDSQGRATSWPAAGADDPIVMSVTADDRPPDVDLEQVIVARPGKELAVTARVWDSSGVKSVRLRYRHTTQYEDYQTEEMQYRPRTGLWSATIPGEFVVPQWDLMYLLEAVDTQGNGRMYPDMETETPYVVVELDR